MHLLNEVPIKIKDFVWRLQRSHAGLESGEGSMCPCVALPGPGQNTVIDLYEFALAAKTVKEFCATAARATVVSAAERALRIKLPRLR